MHPKGESLSVPLHYCNFYSLFKDRLFIKDWIKTLNNVSQFNTLELHLCKFFQGLCGLRCANIQWTLNFCQYRVFNIKTSKMYLVWKTRILLLKIVFPHVFGQDQGLLGRSMLTNIKFSQSNNLYLLSVYPIIIK